MENLVSFGLFHSCCFMSNDFPEVIVLVHFKSIYPRVSQRVSSKISWGISLVLEEFATTPGTGEGYHVSNILGLVRYFTKLFIC